MAAAAQGKLASFWFWPDPQLTGSSALEVLSTWVAVLPVVLLAFISHFNVLPIKASLSDRRPDAMHTVIKAGTLLTTLLYSAVAVAGYVLFGRSTPGNVFTSFTNEYAASLLGGDAFWGAAAVVGVKLAVLWMLFVTFVLKNYGLRECASEAIFGVESLRLPLWKYYSMTYTVLAIVWGLACVLPNVFIVMLFIGATACQLFSYIFPGLLMIAHKVPGGHGPGHVSAPRFAEGCAFVAAGLLFMCLGLWRAVGEVYGSSNSSSSGSSGSGGTS